MSGAGFVALHGTGIASRHTKSVFLHSFEQHAQDVPIYNKITQINQLKPL